MKKPTIRVTKWLGDLPVESGCRVFCVVFRARGVGYRPCYGGCAAPSTLWGFAILKGRYYVCDWCWKPNSRARNRGIGNVDRQMARERNFPKKCSRYTDLGDRRI